MLTGSVAVLLLTLKLLLMTSAYLKDWDANNAFNHRLQWPVRTSYWSAISSESCIPSTLTDGRTGVVEGGSGRSLSLGHRAVQQGRALLLFLLCCLPSLLPKGKADELCPCPCPGVVPGLCPHVWQQRLTAQLWNTSLGRGRRAALPFSYISVRFGFVCHLS